MAKTVTIDPVTRIEGHAKITIHLDEAGKVTEARFHVTEFRGFERFCQGHTFWEMPGLTSRICGICPVSHQLASAKTGDAILGVRIPRPAVKLRQLLNWAQITQSHALSFFHLSGPDLLLGMESDPEMRNIVGLVQKYPQVARNGIRLRQIGQEIIRILGGKSVHPAWVVPGGVREPLSPERRDEIQRMLPDGFDIIELALDLVKEAMDDHSDEIETYGNFPSLHLGLVTPEGGLEHYDGRLRIMDEEGRLLEEGLPPEAYRQVIDEKVLAWSYLKFPFYKPLGFDNGAGMYRVGPLARLNLCDFAGTARADRELRQFRRLGERGKPVTASFYYHYARLIEILFSLEKIEETLQEPDIISEHIRSHASVNELKAIGVSEAPRGTLFHEYEVDQDGIIQKVNMIIATGQNNLAMNRTIKQIAGAYVNGQKLSEGILNRIEHGIRTFDPCLSCSTHAAGQMAMQVQLVSPNNELLDEQVRF